MISVRAERARFTGRDRRERPAFFDPDLLREGERSEPERKKGGNRWSGDIRECVLDGLVERGVGVDGAGDILDVTAGAAHGHDHLVE